MNKIKVSEIKNTDHVGIEFSDERAKIIPCPWEDSGFIGHNINNPRDLLRQSQWDAESKQAYLREAKNCGLVVAKLFQLEEELDQWIKDYKKYE